MQDARTEHMRIKHTVLLARAPGEDGKSPRVATRSGDQKLQKIIQLELGC